MQTIPLCLQRFMGGAAAMGVALPLFGQVPTITIVDLHPPGATESMAFATAEHQQAGRMDGRAAIWQGTPAASTILGGPGSTAADTTGNRQVGYYRLATPPQGIVVEGGVWSGAGDSWTPLPHADPAEGFRTIALAISGDRVVGTDNYFSGSALLWNLADGTVVDLKPPGDHGAVASDIHGTQQVGWLFLGHQQPQQPFHAALWHGTPASFVNLHPAGATDSRAYATSGTIQGGEARFKSQRRAVLWRGTADSMVEVHPAGAESSVIRGAAGDWQSGIAAFAGRNHAGLWRGTAESFVDLHSTLDAATYLDSQAVGMWTDGRTIKVAGSATHLATGNAHAMLWIVSLPDTQPPVIRRAAAATGVLWPPNHSPVTVALEAWVEDNSGPAAWRVTAIACNEAGAEGDMRILDPHTVELRATRSGRGTGRTYTIWLQAEDPAGNLSEPHPVSVIVPHDRGTNPR